MRHADRVALVVAIAAAAPAGAAVAQGGAAAPALLEVLSRVGARVEQYYSRAQSIVCTERVVVQPIRSDMMPEGFGRSLEYELRVEWEPAADGGKPEAKVRRELRKINGRTARPQDEPKCLDPPAISPEPMEFLLPNRQEEYTFALAGSGDDRKRPAVLLDYRGRTPGKPEVTWTDDCTRVSLPGWSKGRVWLDPATNEILRLDEGLTRRFDYRTPYERVRLGHAEYWTLERADSTIRYRSFTFHDPEENILLPESIDSLTVFRGPGVGGHRTSQRFSDYRRFLTGGRIVK